MTDHLHTERWQRLLPCISARGCNPRAASCLLTFACLPALEMVELLTSVRSRRPVSLARASKPRRVMFWMTCVDRSSTVT